MNERAPAAKRAVLKLTPIPARAHIAAAFEERERDAGLVPELAAASPPQQT